MQALAQLGGTLLVFAFLQQLDDLDADRAGKRVAAEGGAVLAGLKDTKDVTAGGDRGDGNYSAAESLAEDVHVGLDAFVVDGEGLTRAAEAALDFVGQEQNVVFGAEAATPVR